MKLQNEFDVRASLENTWTLLLDLERVAACLPGASIEQSSDGNYTGQIRVKLGPMIVSYTGTLELTDANSDTHTATIEVTAKELKGQGTAAARVHSRLTSPNDDLTRVRVETDLTVTGRPAQLGRGIMQEVAASMLKDFARNLDRELAGDRHKGTGSAEDTSSAGVTHRPPELRGEQPDALDIGRALAAPAARRARVAVLVVLVIAWLAARRRLRAQGRRAE
jgi:carbon monoxide dehydrogenase subunit G